MDNTLEKGSLLEATVTRLTCEEKPYRLCVFSCPSTASRLNPSRRLHQGVGSFAGTLLSCRPCHPGPITVSNATLVFSQGNIQLNSRQLDDTLFATFIHNLRITFPILTPMYCQAVSILIYSAFSNKLSWLNCLLFVTASSLGCQAFTQPDSTIILRLQTLGNQHIFINYDFSSL